MINKVLDLFKRFTAWLEDNKQGIFLAGVVGEFILITLISVSLLIAFWLMGLFPKMYDFPMQIGVSCVATICGGIGSLWALYKSLAKDKEAEAEKYKMDSIFNSPKGSMIDDNNNGIDDRKE